MMSLFSSFGLSENKNVTCLIPPSILSQLTMRLVGLTLLINSLFTLLVPNYYHQSSAYSQLFSNLPFSTFINFIQQQNYQKIT